MGQITISLEATTTLDGITTSGSGTMIIPCVAYASQTRDFSDAFEQIGEVAFPYATLVVVNTGDESLFIQMANGTGDYIVFETKAGAHGVYPTSLGNGAAFNVTRVAIRSATALGSRGIIITVQSQTL